MSTRQQDSPTSSSGTATSAPSVDITGGLSFNKLEDIDRFNEVEEVKHLVDFARTEHEKAKSARASIERQWRLNLAMYYGKQNVAFATVGPAAGRLITPKAPPWRVRSVTNRIRPIIRTEFARLTQNKPSASVTPSSSEDKDLMAAQAGLKPGWNARSARWPAAISALWGP